ncbi:MAG: T9SS type A sorting domain-containing protein, partial [Mariniphaga sp.]
CIYPHAAGVPNNFCGHQYAQDGNAYAGIGGSFPSWYRDFIGIQLIQPLLIGEKYYVSFYASLTLDSMWAMNVAFDKLGVKFFASVFTDSVNQANMVNNNAQVYSNLIITDTVGWTNITGSFIADSAYKLMVVGFFFDSIHLNYIKFFNHPSGKNMFNYYLDNFYVSTTPNGVLEIPDVNLNIYPNPVKDILNIRGDIKRSDEILLYDMQMRKVPFKIIKTQNLFQLNVSSLSNGIYLLKLIKKEGNYFSKKIIINN